MHHPHLTPHQTAPKMQIEREIGEWPADNVGLSFTVTNYTEHTWKVDSWHSRYGCVAGKKEWQQYTLLPPHTTFRLPNGEIIPVDPIARGVVYNFQQGWFPPWSDFTVALRIVLESDQNTGFMVKGNVRSVGRNRIGACESLGDWDLKEFYSEDTLKSWVPLIYEKITMQVKPWTEPVTHVHLSPNGTSDSGYHVKVDIR
ncbi:hypothetical protein BXZ70DRAFT_1007219 [Cristinia sonorae]|uniref:Uncharacterized protein n=1 Tax=Cristinia sonorae TaxID=1940300 RepID=A0A8K0UPX2_9AGAR|nr:hypothetical protein BXZ70DRAFT_1007219 [Cristinia sonorae]